MLLHIATRGIHAPKRLNPTSRRNPYCISDRFLSHTSFVPEAKNKDKKKLLKMGGKKDHSGDRETATLIIGDRKKNWNATAYTEKHFIVGYCDAKL